MMFSWHQGGFGGAQVGPVYGNTSSWLPITCSFTTALSITECNPESVYTSWKTFYDIEIVLRRGGN